MLSLPFLIAIAIFPFIVFTLLLLIFKQRLLLSTLVAFVLTFISVSFIWQTPVANLTLSFSVGFWRAYDIGVIVFGALTFLSLLRSASIVDHIVYYLTRLSPDIRVQTIILAWFLENFIEGSAGFGSPGAVVAPILVTMGIPPVNAVAISLIGNSTAGIFGAAGTPTRVGLSAFAGPELTLWGAMLGFIGIFIPFFIIWTLSRSLNNSKIIRGILPFALWSGFLFAFYSFVGSLFGEEFPSIIGSILGLAVLVFSLKFGFLAPATLVPVVRDVTFKPKLSVLQTFLPYIISIGLLAFGRFLLPGSPLFNPGYVFLISSVIVYLFYRPPISPVKTLLVSLKHSFEPFFIILLISSVVQMMLAAKSNPFSYPSPLEIISAMFAHRFLPFIAPFVGAFGAFITGSITLSNIMFGQAVASAASFLGMAVIPVLALQLVGGSLGNMAALADILAAQTVVGISHKEVQVIKLVLLPCLSLLVLLGIVGLIILR